MCSWGSFAVMKTLEEAYVDSSSERGRMVWVWVWFLKDLTVFRWLGKTSGKWGLTVRRGDSLVLLKAWAVCCGLNVCLCPPKFTCWTLIPNMMVYEGGAFRRWLGHEGEAHMNEISALREGIPESPFSLPPCEDMAKSLWTRKKVLTRHWICQHIGLPRLQNCEK